MIEEVKALTVLELSELVHALEEEFGVSAAAMAAPAAGAAAPVAEQKRARSDLLRALLRVSLFERFYARLKSDVISKEAAYFSSTLPPASSTFFFTERG